ncbi:uncharacterized protein ISCGN_014081 [Ixodes scapularis]
MAHGGSQMSQSGSEMDLPTSDAERLIEAVRSRPSLYDLGCIDYRDKLRKENGWASVATICGMKSGEEAQKAWKRLRDKYVRELKAVEVATRSGSGFVRKKQWAFIETMAFYKDHIRVRKTVACNVQAPPVGTTAESILRSMVDSSPEDSPSNLQGDDVEYQGSPGAAGHDMPSTSRGYTSSASAGSSSHPPRCPVEPRPMPSKRKGDGDSIEQELLKHLSCKMTQNEAFAYSVAQSLDRWGERKSARFRAAVMQMAYEYECDDEIQ